MILDETALYAYFVRNAPSHWTISGLIDLRAPRDTLVVPALALAELCRLVGERIGQAAQADVLEELASGAWLLRGLDATHLRAMRALLAEHPDFEPVVASVVAAALEEPEPEIVTLRPIYREVSDRLRAPLRVVPGR